MEGEIEVKKLKNKKLLEVITKTFIFLSLLLVLLFYIKPFSGLDPITSLTNIYRNYVTPPLVPNIASNTPIVSSTVPNNVITIRGPQGIQGIQGPRGPKGESVGVNIDTSSFVTKEFFDKQVERIYDSMHDSIQNISISEGGGGGGGSVSNYTNLTPTPVTVGGIVAGSTFSAQTMEQMFDQLLYPYIAPSLTLSLSPANGTVREFGNDVATITLNATTTKNTNDITLVEFYRGASLVHTQAVPIASGGLETYIDTTPVTTNGITFTAKAGDGTQTTTSSGSSYTFVYPFYYGVDAPGLTGAQIRTNLTMLIKTPSNTTTVTSPSSEVFYLAYPDTSPALTSILDTNGFETISDYTLRTVSITGLDGAPQTYKVYEYNNLTTQSNFTNQFKF